jgi:predicted GH43/DUF377 family glycosyl hydrolase
MFTSSLLCAILSLSTVSAAFTIAKRAPAISPAISQDFADPSIISVNGGWYAFATSGNGVHVQLAVSNNFDNWNRYAVDVLPNLPSWVDQNAPGVWGPNVVQLVCSSPQYLLFQPP